MKRFILVAGMAVMLAAVVFIPFIGYAQTEEQNVSLLSQLSAIVAGMRESLVSIANSLGGAVMNSENEPYDAQLVTTTTLSGVIANRHPILTDVRTTSVAREGSRVVLRVGSWDPNGDAYKVWVNWGDGAPLSLISVPRTSTPKVTYATTSHIYQMAGTKNTVKVMAEDEVAYGISVSGGTSSPADPRKGGSAAVTMVVPVESGSNVVPALTVSTIAGSGASPAQDQIVPVNTFNGTYLAFRLSASNEAQKLTSLTFAAENKNGRFGAQNLQNFRLYRQVGTGAIESVPFSSFGQLSTCVVSAAVKQCSYKLSAADNLLTDLIKPGVPVNVYVRANIADAGAADLGADFRLLVTNVTGKSAQTGKASSVTGNIAAVGKTQIVPFVVKTEGDYPKTPVITGTGAGSILGRFKVQNDGNATSVILTNMRINLSGNIAPGMRFQLSSSHPGEDANDASIEIATSSLVGGSLFGSLTGSTPASRTIRSGSWRYYTVKTLGVANNNDSVSLSINALGDVMHSVDEASIGYSGNPDMDADISDTITGLWTDGKPSLASVTMKN